MKYNIVLSGKNNLSSSGYNSQMLPIRGKPIIGWVLEQLNHSENIIIVLDKNNIKTQEYIKIKYPKIKIIFIDKEKEISNFNYFSIINSINIALHEIKDDCDILKIILGDTVIKNTENNYKDDIILTSNNFISSERWCLVDCDENNYIKNFYDKKINLDISNKKVVAGYYQFTDLSLLKNIIQNTLSLKQETISYVLNEYNKIKKIKCINTNIWFDLGHKDGIIKAENNFFNSRDFNTLYSDPISGIIKKSSTKKQKLTDEYDWYLSLPKDIQILSPRIINFEENLENATLTMEMYGYLPLSEFFILGKLNIEEWCLILDRLFNVHKLLEKHKGNLNKDNFLNLYYNKTWDRLEELKKQNIYWENLYNYNEIIINNKKYKNIESFKDKINESINKIIDNIDITIMHGDYCFSNILFDVNSFIVRLIDPRGRLKEKTIYGDPRYDIAKLRHSVVGKYDFIVHGLFTLEEKENIFNYKIQSLLFQEKINKYFDDLVINFKFNLFEIKLIESLLFISMIPLHKDNFERQKMFYLIGVEKINELFNMEI